MRSVIVFWTCKLCGFKNHMTNTCGSCGMTIKTPKK